MIQGTQEWFDARLGKVTASRIADVLAKTKSGPAASRKNYLVELVCERMTGVQAESFMSAAMQWGIEHEEEARSLYHFDVAPVEDAGFVDHPTIANSGASPDGYVGSDGLVEIKCPNTATHLDTVESGKIGSKYYAQMQWQMDCTGRQWCDFVSYDPRVGEQLQLWVIRVERDEQWLEAARQEVETFLSEVDERVERLKEKAQEGFKVG